MIGLSLDGKYALICGSSDGIGLATAQTMAELGANCILLARNEQKLADAVNKLPTVPTQQHRFAVADFDKLEEVESVINQIIKEIKVSILVNNSGGPAAGPLLASSSSAFQRAFNRHVLCNQILSKAVIPTMKELGYGRIINIISTSVKSPLPNLGVSNTIRAAVASWAKTLANEIGAFNITVNNVLPGATRTTRLTSLLEQTAIDRNVTTDQIEEEMIKGIPMRRFGYAEEIANVITFLASPAASYVTGINIPVDGGRTPSL
ncbi:MAG TPA: SDR family oxidoreductase [Pseudosphingobacterium sp.]|nr:SDR family oxidoreductase [Pseudosphingobacterium sp.]